jgi:hypothetical protein
LHSWGSHKDGIRRHLGGTGLQMLELVDITVPIGIKAEDNGQQGEVCS